MTRIVLVAVVVVAMIGIAARINNSQQAPSAAGQNFFEPAQDFPTSGGQEIAPRWNASEGAADAAAD